MEISFNSPWSSLLCLQGEVLSPMATDDEDLARQQYESSGRKKKKHKKDRDSLGA